MPKQCPKCSGPTQLNGIRNGVQGWRCPKCGAAGYDTARKQGGQLGDTLPVSGADRARKCREKKKEAKDLTPILQPKINMQLRIRSCQEERPKNTTYADRFYALAASRGETPIGAYVNAGTKVELKCKNGHRFAISPNAHKSGSGCPKCSGDCPEQAKESFLELLKTNGGTLHSPYVKALTKVEIKCKEGHLFMMSPNHYKNGQGCKTCYLNRRYPDRAPTSLSTIGRVLIDPPE